MSERPEYYPTPPDEADRKMAHTFPAREQTEKKLAQPGWEEVDLDKPNQNEQEAA